MPMISYLSDGVGAGAVGDLSGSRAVGGVGSKNLSGVADGTVVAVGGGTGHEGSRGSDGGGTHFDYLSYWFLGFLRLVGFEVEGLSSWLGKGEY